MQTNASFFLFFFCSEPTPMLSSVRQWNTHNEWCWSGRLCGLCQAVNFSWTNIANIKINHMSFVEKYSLISQLHFSGAAKVIWFWIESNGNKIILNWVRKDMLPEFIRIEFFSLLFYRKHFRGTFEEELCTNSMNLNINECVQRSLKISSSNKNLFRLKTNIVLKFL